MTDRILAAIARTTRFMIGDTRRCSAADFMLERGVFSGRRLVVPRGSWTRIQLALLGQQWAREDLEAQRARFGGP